MFASASNVAMVSVIGSKRLYSKPEIKRVVHRVVNVEQGPLPPETVTVNHFVSTVYCPPGQKFC